MERTSGAKRQYAWGSDTVIQEHSGVGEPGKTLAEVWFGAYRLLPSVLLSDESVNPILLVGWISTDSKGTLGVSMVKRFGARLPYLIKLTAPKWPLSLQVHPGRRHVQLMLDVEERARIPPDAIQCMHKNPNHKPELAHVLICFEALAGFCALRRIVEVFSDLDTELATQIVSQLRAQPSPGGTREVTDRLPSPHTTPAAPQVEATVAVMSDRLQAGASPSVRVDRVATSLARQYPRDAGAVVAAMLNPVSLRPDKVLFTPSGGTYVYVSRLGVEIMANSDSVSRTGLAEKHVDCQELSNCPGYAAAPSMWTILGWVTSSTQVFYTPVDDLELSVTKLGDPQLLSGRGGWIVLCIRGETILSDTEADQLRSLPGQTVSVHVDKTPVYVSGHGVMM